MKRTILSRLAPLPVMAMALAFTSCIYDSTPGDEFYRTLWKSDEVPLGPFDASSLTLEFLCGEGVSIKTTAASADTAGPSAFGTYSFDGATAVFDKLEIKYGSDSIRTGTEGLEGTDGYGSSDGSDKDITITFLEAHRNGDTLFLLWRVEDMLYPFTTAMRRLSEYED